MKVNLFLNAAGQEALVKGTQLNYYNFDVRFTTDSVPEHYGWLVAPPQGAALVAVEVEITLPSKESAARQALAKIEAERQVLRAELAKNLQELAEREQSLLALTYNSTNIVEAQS